VMSLYSAREGISATCPMVQECGLCTAKANQGASTKKSAACQDLELRSSQLNFRSLCAKTCNLCESDRPEPTPPWAPVNPCYGVGLSCSRQLNGTEIGCQGPEMFKACTPSECRKAESSKTAVDGCVVCPKGMMLTSYQVENQVATCASANGNNGRGAIRHNHNCVAQCTEDHGETSSGLFCVTNCIKTDMFVAPDADPPAYYTAYCFVSKRVWCRPNGQCAITKRVELARLCKGRTGLGGGFGRHRTCYYSDQSVLDHVFTTDAPKASRSANKMFNFNEGVNVPNREIGFDGAPPSLSSDLSRLCFKVGINT